MPMPQLTFVRSATTPTYTKLNIYFYILKHHELMHYSMFHIMTFQCIYIVSFRIVYNIYHFQILTRSSTPPVTMFSEPSRSFFAHAQLHRLSSCAANKQLDVTSTCINLLLIQNIQNPSLYLI